jgi:hypothetical protein
MLGSVRPIHKGLTPFIKSADEPSLKFTLTSDRFSCIALTSRCSELRNPQTDWQCPPKHIPLTTEAYRLCNPAPTISESLAVRRAGIRLVSLSEAARAHQGIILAQGRGANDEEYAYHYHLSSYGRSPWIHKRTGC